MLEARDVALSVQVPQEFYVQATRLSRSDPLTHERAVELVETFLAFPVQETTTRLVTAALATARRLRDLLLGRHDPRSGPHALLRSRPLRGLNDGQNYAGVRVEDLLRSR